MKHIEVVAAIILRQAQYGSQDSDSIFCTQRGYGEFKDWWEFPGGKMEPGETPQEALKREIREELATEIEVGELLTTVEYDYPNFHLTMHCYMCRVVSGNLTLLEHESAKWLTREELDSVNWLPADKEIIELLKKRGSRGTHHGNCGCLLMSIFFSVVAVFASRLLAYYFKWTLFITIPMIIIGVLALSWSINEYLKILRPRGKQIQ